MNTYFAEFDTQGVALVMLYILILAILDRVEEKSIPLDACTDDLGDVLEVCYSLAEADFRHYLHNYLIMFIFNFRSGSNNTLCKRHLGIASTLQYRIMVFSLSYDYMVQRVEMNLQTFQNNFSLKISIKHKMFEN